MRKTLSILCSIVLSAFCLTRPAYAESLEKIVAIVNDNVITQSQFNDAVLNAKRQFQASRMQTDLTERQFRQQVLNNLVLEDLQLQMAKRAGLTVDDTDVNRAIDAIAKRNALSAAEFKKVLDEKGMAWSVYKKQIRQQVLIARLQQEVISPNITVTQDNINEFRKQYANHQKQAIEYRIETILIPFFPDEALSQKSQAQKAKLLMRTLNNNKPLSQSLKEIYGSRFSNEIASVPKVLGMKTQAQLPSLFQAVVPKMRVGTFSSPIKAPNGFHILHLLGKSEKNKNLTKVQITQLIYQQKFQQELQRWLEELRRTSYVKIMNN
jgi:peptidyl-prolyl cis-trans isomerase SurA